MSHPAPTGPQTHHAPNAALLIDFDNVTMGIRSDLQTELKNLLSADIVKGKVAVQRAYADWRRYPQYVVPLTESSIDLIFATAYGSAKKNATDIRLAIDAMELVFIRPEIGTFILLSGDSDFSSLVIKLKEYGKYVIGVGIRESSSDLLVQNCDEYYSYNALAGLVKFGDEETVKRDPWELVTEAVTRMKRNGDVMRADRLKQVMQQIDTSFDEKNLGMSKFSRFVSEAAHRGLLVLTKLENGQFEVGAPGAGSTTSASAAEPAAARSAPSGDESETSERPRRSRRGGRGRDRGERGPRPGAATPDSMATPGMAQELEDAPLVLTTPRTAPAPASNGDLIGAEGLRLTREDAFNLVRRSVAAGEGLTLRASEVRTKARSLLGRDSESLSERNFLRILQDAHDADVIDLRRRGTDYEVAPSATAAPLSEQIAAAEPPRVAAPAAPSAPQGMGARGGGSSRGRGRGPIGGKAGAPPPDLFKFGVVEASPAFSAPAVEAEAIAEDVPAAEGKARGARKRAAPRGRKQAARDAGSEKPAPKRAVRKTKARSTESS
ncbi:MAG: NYN domain-containing protein [Gemmatimonadaceae bacterium]|nr:NYN domain-containing protein [Gemmatimonadaceae bacterium]